MRNIDEHLERLITRHLDGELSNQEQQSFTQLLAEDTDAKHALEDSKQIDRLAAAWLSDLSTRSRSSQGDFYGVMRQLNTWLPLALAACVLLWIGLDPMTPTANQEERIAKTTQDATAPTMPRNQHAVRPLTNTHTVGHFTERAPTRSVDTTLDYLGVYDEATNSWYLIEVKGTAKQHRRPAAPFVSAGGM